MIPKIDELYDASVSNHRISPGLLERKVIEGTELYQRGNLPMPGHIKRKLTWRQGWLKQLTSCRSMNKIITRLLFWFSETYLLVTIEENRRILGGGAESGPFTVSLCGEDIVVKQSVFEKAGLYHVKIMSTKFLGCPFQMWCIWMNPLRLCSCTLLLPKNCRHDSHFRGRHWTIFQIEY